jgi:hypothetical protein
MGVIINTSRLAVATAAAGIMRHQPMTSPRFG